MRVEQSSGLFTPGPGSVLGLPSYANSPSSSETDLTLLGEVGVAIALTPNWSVVPAYRLQWINNGGGGVDDTWAHNIRVSVRYSF